MGVFCVVLLMGLQMEGCKKQLERGPLAWSPHWKMVVHGESQQLALIQQRWIDPKEPRQMLQGFLDVCT